MRKFLGTAFIVLLVMFFAGCFMAINGIMGELHVKDPRVAQPSILFLKLDGIILDGDEFLKNLRKYADDDQIKGVLVQINSPGGVVGPSQEIYAELNRVSKELKKPVVATCLGLAASGGYYAALAADKIIVNPGALLGSIGVIMEFANLEKLYEWAKIRRFSIKTGAYKDSGAEYREMREDEKLVFQELANEVLAQFKKAVAESRKLTPEAVSRYSDGRVFTGDSAVKMGLADAVGTLTDAQKAIGELTGLGDKPKIFEPPKRRPHVFDLLVEASTNIGFEGQVGKLFAEVTRLDLHSQLRGQLLYLMPGVL